MIPIKEFLANNEFGIKTHNQLEWAIKNEKKLFKPKRGFVQSSEYTYFDDIDTITNKNLLVGGYKACFYHALTDYIPTIEEIDVIAVSGYNYKNVGFKTHYAKAKIHSSDNIIDNGLKIPSIHKTIALIAYYIYSYDKEIIDEVVYNYNLMFTNFKNVEKFARKVGIWSDIKKVINKWELQLNKSMTM